MAAQCSEDVKTAPQPGDMVLCSCCHERWTPYKLPYPVNEQLCDACIEELEEMRREGGYP
ncbi:hypothetical protein LMG10661_03423 [Ralstonia syzygii subsp. syzygii]|nr:hypothetical protein LMG10661_03423 [Ralstonia syzygii subsp. syzygii]